MAGADGRDATVGASARETGSASLPNPKAAAAGGGRFDLDVPAFLRKQGGGGGGE